MLLPETQAKAVRESFNLIVGSSQRFTPVGAYGNCEDAIAAINRDKPEIVLIVFEVLRKQGVIELHGIVPTVVCAIIAMVAGSWWDKRKVESTTTASDEAEQPMTVPTV